MTQKQWTGLYSSTIQTGVSERSCTATKPVRWSSHGINDRPHRLRSPVRRSWSREPAMQSAALTHAVFNPCSAKRAMWSERDELPRNKWWSRQNSKGRTVSTWPTKVTVLIRTERYIQAVEIMGTENEEVNTQDERVLNHLDHSPSHPTSSGCHQPPDIEALPQTGRRTLHAEVRSELRRTVRAGASSSSRKEKHRNTKNAAALLRERRGHTRWGGAPPCGL